VKREQVIDAVEVTALGHRLAAAGDLLCRLEEHLSVPSKGLCLTASSVPVSRRDREVRVVAAGVHVPVVPSGTLRRRPVIGLRRFVNRDRVEIDAQADTRPLAL